MNHLGVEECITDSWRTNILIELVNGTITTKKEKKGQSANIL